VYIATGFQQPTIIAVRPDGKGDVTKTHIVWTLPKGAPLTPSPVIVGDELYLVNDGGVAICLNAKTGAPIWVQRLPGPHSASPVVADGHIYFLSEDAVTTVITAGAEFHVLATNQLDGTAYASMAVSTGSFFIRTDKFLYRIGK
jgi:outer membrane protein assembly factor BamB